MDQNKKELEQKIAAAGSPEEIERILNDAGEKIGPEDAAKLFEKLQNRKADGGELSPDELEAVSGGVRDWVTEGCAATVECGSICWSDDHCILVYEHYSNSPISITCPKCGTYFYKYEQRSTSNPFAKIPVYYICKTCGYREFAYYLD